MKTEKELNADILKITMKIDEMFPELSKYIAEMPVKVPENISADISLKNLQDYYDSLAGLLKKYTTDHESAAKQNPEKISTELPGQ